MYGKGTYGSKRGRPKKKNKGNTNLAKGGTLKSGTTIQEQLQIDPRPIV